MLEALLQGAKLGLIPGFICGLLPLVAGLYRRRPKSAAIGFVGSLALGALFGFYGALIFSIFTAAAIWRGEPIRGAREETTK